MDCSKYCSLCNNQKVEFINLTKYHGTCGNHQLSEIITCIHCKALVPHIKVPPRDVDINYIENKVKDVGDFKHDHIKLQRPNENFKCTEKFEDFREPAQAEVFVRVEPIQVEIGKPLQGNFVDKGFEVIENKKSEDLNDNKGFELGENEEKLDEHELFKEEKFQSSSPEEIKIEENSDQDKDESRINREIGQENNKETNFFKYFFIVPLLITTGFAYMHREGIYQTVSRSKRQILDFLVNSP